MIIQHNIPALNAYRQMSFNTRALAANLEKLSSGFRINRAGDDAAGLAISEKMRAQIKGLETAQKNALDGISLIQTAEGALTEVHSMLNRMTELATQAANGIYDDSVDRAALDLEFQQLKTEIDRISQATNFNGRNLLDGSLSISSGTAHGVGSAKAIQVISEAVEAAKAFNRFDGVGNLVNGADPISAADLRPDYDVFAGDSFTLDLDLTDILNANSDPSDSTTRLSGPNTLNFGDWTIRFDNAGTASDGTTDLAGISITATNLSGSSALSGTYADINEVLEFMTKHDENWSFSLNDDNQIVLTADVNGTGVNKMADQVNGTYRNGASGPFSLEVTGDELLNLNGNLHNATHDGNNTSLTNRVSIVDTRPTVAGEVFNYAGFSAGTAGGTVSGAAQPAFSDAESMTVNGYTLTFDGDFGIAPGTGAGSITVTGGEFGDTGETFVTTADLDTFEAVLNAALDAMSKDDANWRYSYDNTSDTFSLTAKVAGLDAPGRLTFEEGGEFAGATGVANDATTLRAVSGGVPEIDPLEDESTITLAGNTYTRVAAADMDLDEDPREWSTAAELLDRLNADFEEDGYVFSFENGALVATALEDGAGKRDLGPIEVMRNISTTPGSPELVEEYTRSVFEDGVDAKEAVIREVPLGTGANKISADLMRYLEFGQSTPVAAVKAAYKLADTSEVEFLERLGVGDATNTTASEILTALGLSGKDYDVFSDYSLSTNTGTAFNGDASEGVYIVAKQGGVDANRSTLFQMDNSSVWELREGADAYRELTMIVKEDVSDGNLINKTFTLNGIDYTFKGQFDIDENDVELGNRPTARLADGSWAINLSALRFNNEAEGVYVDGLEASQQVAKAIMEAVNMAEAIRIDPAAVDPVEHFAEIGRGINSDIKTDQKHIITFNMAIGAGGAGGVFGSGGGLNIQIGDTADAHNILSVSVNDMSSKGLGIDKLSVATYDLAKAALGDTNAQGQAGTIKNAINMVSTQRAELGSLQNRLDYTINNIGVTTENIIAAESRIRDTDMAKEMMMFTKNNIVLQASMAMLAQANMLPQGVLMLIR